MRKVGYFYTSARRCCRGQCRCPSLCSSRSFQLDPASKAASQTHSGGQHFTNRESACVSVRRVGGAGGGGGGPLLSAIWANGRSLCQHCSHRRKRARGHSRKLRRRTGGGICRHRSFFLGKKSHSGTPVLPLPSALLQTFCQKARAQQNYRLQTKDFVGSAECVQVNNNNHSLIYSYIHMCVHI